jgi:hypothetical protein
MLAVVPASYDARVMWMMSDSEALIFVALVIATLSLALMAT